MFIEQAKRRARQNLKAEGPQRWRGWFWSVHARMDHERVRWSEDWDHAPIIAPANTLTELIFRPHTRLMWTTSPGIRRVPSRKYFVAGQRAYAGAIIKSEVRLSTKPPRKSGFSRGRGLGYIWLPMPQEGPFEQMDASHSSNASSLSSRSRTRTSARFLMSWIWGRRRPVALRSAFSRRTRARWRSASERACMLVETVRNSVPRRFDHAIGNRSSNMMASWLFTASHSRTDRFHS